MTTETGLFILFIGGIISVGILLFSIVVLILCEFGIYLFAGIDYSQPALSADNNEDIWLMTLAAAVWA